VRRDSTSPKLTTGSDLPGVKTFPDLQSYMAKTAAGHRALVGDLYGTWTIPAAYIQASVQSHTAATVAEAVAAPIDPTVIARIARFGTYCASSGADPCIDGTFHNGADGALEQAFDAGYAANDIGFSERSFFLDFTSRRRLHSRLSPCLGGDQPGAPKLAYSDAFVTSRATCGKEPCATDAAGFAAFMTGAATKKYIALGSDLPGGDPPRHLIVATKPFYDDDDVKADPVYKQLASGFLKGEIRPYLNSFTPRLQYDLLSGICPILQQQSPGWKCKVPKKPN
jgi:hypothetical protein